MSQKTTLKEESRIRE